MDKILKFSSPRSPTTSYKRPPRLNTLPYYSEHEEDHDYYIDANSHGNFVKVYTKKEPVVHEVLKPIYETDQELMRSSSKAEHLGHHHQMHPNSGSHFKKTPHQHRKKNQRHRQFRTNEVHSGDKIKKIYYKAYRDDNLKTHPFRHLIFSPSIPEQVFKRHINMLYRGLLYAKNCLKGPSESFLEKKRINLKEPTEKRTKTLFLDLDETLIHSCSMREKNCVVVKTLDEDDLPFQQAFKIRPFCLEFLEEMSKIYEVYIFTASNLFYAKSIISFLDPENQFISGILDRTHCLKTTNGFFIKDLRIIRNRELKNMVIVDNLAHSFGFQIANGVPILEWHDSFKDQELMYLKKYLIEAEKEEDVREFNMKRLRLAEMQSLKKEDLHI